MMISVLLECSQIVFVPPMVNTDKYYASTMYKSTCYYCQKLHWGASTTTLRAIAQCNSAITLHKHCKAETSTKSWGRSASSAGGALCWLQSSQKRKQSNQQTNTRIHKQPNTGGAVGGGRSVAGAQAGCKAHHHLHPVTSSSSKWIFVINSDQLPNIDLQ